MKKTIVWFLAVFLIFEFGATWQNAFAQSKTRKKQKASNTKLPNYSGVVSQIDILGSKKIEAEAIRAKLKTKVGQSINTEKLREDVQNIFNMGYFYNIEIDKTSGPSGVVLTYKVTEKPTVIEIVFKGNDKIDKDDLSEAIGMRQFTILDHNKIREAVEKMQKLYEEKGFFLAKIQSKLEEVKNTSDVRVVFDIKENDKVKVKKITFLGNKNLPDSKLKAFLQTQEGGFFSWLTSSGGYKQDLFDRDVQVLNYIYFNEGYIQVKIDRPQVYVTPDKKSIFITIRIEEGDQFRVGKVDFGGDLLFTKDELFEATEIHKTEIFSSEVLKKDIQALQFKYGDLGYAYANPIPKTNIHEKEKVVDITFEIEKGQKVYFGEFTVVGNTKTRDKVVRRELKIKEGELYNETRRKKSEENVKRLGFFSDVVFNSSAPADDPNVMNIEIQVKERSTGTLQVGAGYSTVQQAIFNGNVSQTNLFGKGQDLRFNIQLSKDVLDTRFGFTEPYFNDTLWSTGVDLFYTKSGLGGYYTI
ncbi:MAG: outer membrane protein assembly factor BamA [Oligoflexia bacterium]|nr:outer membrane protein assembly factor BamA [Oligoflexia bacterium]